MHFRQYFRAPTAYKIRCPEGIGDFALRVVFGAERKLITHFFCVRTNLSLSEEGLQQLVPLRERSILPYFQYRFARRSNGCFYICLLTGNFSVRIYDLGPGRCREGAIA
jgi:hypothetical protein